MQDLYQRLDTLFPDHGENDWELQDNGDGPQITRWSRPESQPSDTVLAAVSQAQIDSRQESHGLARAFEMSKKDQVLIKWIAQRTGGGTPASIMTELRNIWRTTQ